MTFVGTSARHDKVIWRDKAQYDLPTITHIGEDHNESDKEDERDDTRMERANVSLHVHCRTDLAGGSRTRVSGPTLDDEMENRMFSFSGQGTLDLLGEETFCI